MKKQKRNDERIQRMEEIKMNPSVYIRTKNKSGEREKEE